MKKLNCLFLALSFILFLCCASAEEWQSFRKSSFNNGLQTVNETYYMEPFAFKTKGLIWSTPVIDGQVYTGSADKYFYALEKNGSLAWKYKINDELDSLIDSAGLILDDKIIIPGGDGYIHAVNKTNGEKLWEFKAYHATEEQVNAGVLVNSFEGNVVLGPDSRIYAGSDNSHMYCLDEEGSELWNFRTGMMIWSAPVFHPENKWMAFGSLDGYFYLLNPKDGKLLDKIKIGEIKASPSYNHVQKLIFVGTSAGEMYAFKIARNKLKKIWKFNAGNEIYSSASYYNKRIYFGSADGKLYCLDYNGNPVWEYNAYSPIASSPAIIKDRMIVFGAGNGKIYALNFNGERIWSFRTTENKHKANLDSSPAVSRDGRIYIGSYNGNIYGISIDYCLKNKDDSRCEFGGREDSPENNGKQIMFEDRKGNLQENITAGLSEPVKLKLIVFEEDKYVPNSAVNTFGLDIKIKPEINFDYKVSGDGYFINIIPDEFWEPEQEYNIEIRGKYYKKTNFFFDRLKWFFLDDFRGNLNFSTKEEGLREYFIGNRTFEIRNIGLFQPLSINTLIAAGVDGQKFIAEIFDVEEDNFSMRLASAYEKDEKLYEIEKSERDVILKGKFKGKYFYAKGNPVISGMGATVPLENSVISGEIEKGNIKNGVIFSETSCLKLKGNAGKYNFPLSVVGETCGPEFNLVAMAAYN